MAKLISLGADDNRAVGNKLMVAGCDPGIVVVLVSHLSHADAMQICLRHSAAYRLRIYHQA